MQEPSPSLSGYRFGVFEVDLRAGKIRKKGFEIKLQEQPLQVLTFLLQNSPNIVAREDLRKRLWDDDTFVEFDHGLSNAIGRIRQALGDSADNPRFIETLPKRGYRFIAPVEELVASQVTPAPTNNAKSNGANSEGLPSELDHPQASSDLQKATLGQRSLSDFGTPVVEPVAEEIASEPPNRLARYAGLLLGFTLLVVVSGATFWFESRRIDSVSVPIRSLAVLPLKNMSGDPSQDYLADGMTEELITGLGQIRALRIISPITAMQYKNTYKPLPQISKELNVDAVIEGSVVRLGDRVRIAAQLIEAPVDKQLWAHSYEGDTRDILGLQNQVAATVVEQIRVKLTSKEQTQLADTRQVNPQAYEAFLKGYFFDQNSGESEQKSLEYFRHATELDPKFARAYVGIGRSYNFLAGWGVVPFGEATAASDAAVAKALELEPELAEAFAERAWTLMMFHWDFPGAERDFRHAMELDPGSSDIHDGLGTYFVIMGRFDEGLKQMRHAVDLDPLSLQVNADYCAVLRFARQYDNAVARCKATLELDPKYKWALYNLSMLNKDKIHGATGAATSFDAWIRSQKEPQDAFFISSAYARLGMKDQAFAWLQTAYEQRSHLNLMTFLPVDPEFDQLRSDPRFDAFLRQVGLPPQPHIGPN